MTMTSPSPNTAMLSKAEIGIPGGVAGLDAAAQLIAKQYPSVALGLYPAAAYGKMTPEADVRDAVNAAILAADAAGGGTVVLPPGTFVLSGQLNGRSRVALRGAGDGVTWLRLADGTIASGSYFLFRANGRQHVKVQGITFDGGTGHPSNHPTIGIAFNSCQDFEVSDCGFTRCRRALYVSNADVGGLRCERGRFFRLYFDATIENIGIDMSDHSDAYDMEIEDVYFAGIVKQDPNLAPWTAIHFRGQIINVNRTTVASSADTAFMATGPGTTGVHVDGNDFTSQQVTIYVGQGATGAHIQGNDLTSLRDYLIHLNSGSVAGQPQDMDATVVGNRGRSSGKTSIMLEGVNRVAVQANTLNNPGGLRATQPALPEQEFSGVVVNPGTASGGGEFITIRGNVITDDRADPQLGFGVFVQTPSGVTVIDGNMISGNRLEDVRDLGVAYVQTRNNTAPKPTVVATLAGGRYVQFTTSVTDPEGGPFTYAWSFGHDKTTSTEQNPLHYYPLTAGDVFYASVTVTDPAGALTRKKVQVTVPRPILRDGFAANGDGSTAVLDLTYDGYSLGRLPWTFDGPGNWIRGVAGAARINSGGASRVAAKVTVPARPIRRVEGIVGAVHATTPNLEMNVRYQDADNNIQLRSQGSTKLWGLQTRVAGTATFESFGGVMPAPNDRVETVDTGTEIRFYVNGVLKATKTTSQFASATVVGLSQVQNSDNASTWTDFAVYES